MDKRNDISGFEVDLSKLFSDTGSAEEVFYLKEVGQRKLYLNEEVEDGSVWGLVRHIIQYNMEDEGKAPEGRKPILLYITSRGGDVINGFELIDVIRTSKTPVYTINLGYEYSMAMLIGLAGHKRYAMPNASFLLHDGGVYISNSGFKAQDQMEFIRKIDEKTKEYVLSLSKLTEEEYDRKKTTEWYMFADEAKEKGFVDYIIGVDCEFSDIV